jgi:hypothetical protein
MTHMDEEQFVQSYYGEGDEMFRRHIEDCAECRTAYERLKELLDSISDYPVPERNSAYGAEVWARLTPHLPLARPRPFWFRWWVLGPALAAVLIIAFWAGMLTQQKQAGISATARQRVLLMAISDHLERSQVVLTELVHADAETADISYERERARDLVNENRLLRESAADMDDSVDAGLLDELERVLLDVANSPSTLQQHDLQAIQQRIESEGLLFKVRVTGTNAREKGQKL